MPSSNRGMSGRGNGTITVIQEPVMRAYRRKAKIVFYVTWVITAVLAATVAASRWHPIIALLAGLVWSPRTLVDRFPLCRICIRNINRFLKTQRTQLPQAALFPDAVVVPLDVVEYRGPGLFGISP